MKKFLISILFAGVMSSFATTTNTVYIDVNDQKEFELQMAPETGETNVIQFKLYKDRKSLNISSYTPVLYAARDATLSRNIFTLTGTVSGNTATFTTSTINLSTAQNGLYMQIALRSGTNPSLSSTPYSRMGRLYIKENPVTQIGDAVLIADNVYGIEETASLAASAVQPEDLGTMAYAETDDFVALAGSGAGYTFYADGSGGGTWAAAANPTNGITQASADLLYAGISSESYPWYGVAWAINQSVPDLTRVGNLGMHKTLPVQEQMYACVINDAGETVYILDGEDWSKTDFGYDSNLDGTDGQVMVHIPEFYFDAVTNAGNIEWRISAEPLVGFEKSPEMFVGAFEASVYREAGVTTNLCSVINTDPTYRGGNNNAAWDGTESNLLGKAATSLSRTQFRTYARARGEGWEMYNYLAHRAITILFTVEYATRNSQKAVNTALDANGYKQGGLGAGVTTVDTARWTAFNAQSPFVPIGTAISIASGTGEVEYTLPAAFSNTVASVMVPVYRGIENPFGHIRKHCDGLNVQIFANGEVDPSSYAWISNDPDTWNDSNYTGYLNVGKISRTGGYVVSMLLGHTLTSSSVGGSSSTYWCDNFYTALPASGSSLRVAALGGSAVGGTVSGFGDSNTAETPMYTASSVGTRLFYSDDL